MFILKASSSSHLSLLAYTFKGGRTESLVEDIDERFWLHAKEKGKVNRCLLGNKMNFFQTKWCRGGTCSQNSFTSTCHCVFGRHTATAIVDSQQ
jgi:hypothetical protein